MFHTTYFWQYVCKLHDATVENRVSVGLLVWFLDSTGGTIAISNTLYMSCTCTCTGAKGPAASCATYATAGTAVKKLSAVIRHWRISNHSVGLCVLEFWLFTIFMSISWLIQDTVIVAKCVRRRKEKKTVKTLKRHMSQTNQRSITADPNFCFDIWRVTNADYLLTYLLKCSCLGNIKQFSY